MGFEYACRDEGLGLKYGLGFRVEGFGNVHIWPFPKMARQEFMKGRMFDPLSPPDTYPETYPRLRVEFGASTLEVAALNLDTGAV